MNSIFHKLTHNVRPVDGTCAAIDPETSAFGRASLVTVHLGVQPEVGKCPVARSGILQRTTTYEWASRAAVGFCSVM